MAFNRMEYEDALPGDRNLALHCPKASPRKLLRGIGAPAAQNRLVKQIQFPEVKKWTTLP